MNQESTRDGNLSTSPASNPWKSRALRASMLVGSMFLGLFVGEIVIRVKNRAMDNYDIEMWRYSKELKRAAENPILGHVHLANATATLQSREIRLNDWGLRGGPISERVPGRRRILLLGSSITLGWGVDEAGTLSERLRSMFEEDGEIVEVLNGGVGNYNTVRYVELFMTQLKALEPTDIIVHYFINDAEILPPGGGNFLLRNSQIVATLWTALQKSATAHVAHMDDHYRTVYEPDSAGFVAMKDSLVRLDAYCDQRGIRLCLAIAPDVHNLEDYPFHYIHRILGQVSEDLGIVFIDLFPGFEGLKPEKVWSMPGDPHPNGLGHRIMAETIYPVIRRPGGGRGG